MISLKTVLVASQIIFISAQVVFDDDQEPPARGQFGNNVVLISVGQQSSSFRRPQQSQSFQRPNNNGFGFQQNPNSAFGQNNNGFQNSQGSFSAGNFNGFQNQRPTGFSNNQNVNLVSSRNPDCRTFEDAGGFCTPLPACGRIARVIQNRSPFVAARILRRSLCGFSGGVPSVCCPSSRNFNQRPNFPPNNANFGNGDNFGSGNFNGNNNIKTPGFSNDKQNEQGGGLVVIPPTAPGFGNGKGNEQEGGIVEIPPTTPEFGNGKGKEQGGGLVIIPPSTPVSVQTTPAITPTSTQAPSTPQTSEFGDGPVALLKPGQGTGRETGFSTDGLPEDCGFSNASNTRIVGGKVAEKGAWPWLAALGYKDSAGNVNYLCGGALVSPNYVITASHCLHGRNDLSSVRLGDHDIFSTSDNVEPIEAAVEKIIMHPNYDPSTFHNDIALLRLKTPVKYTNQIRPICLPNTLKLRSERFENSFPYVAGWGAIQFNGPSSSVLRQVQVPTVPDEVCQAKYASFKTAIVDDSNICAGFQTGGKDACQGDSGGPLQQAVGTNRYVLIGVVSFGFKCAEPDFPGVYTRITSHLDWIQNTITGGK